MLAFIESLVSSMWQVPEDSNHRSSPALHCVPYWHILAHERLTVPALSEKGIGLMFPAYMSFKALSCGGDVKPWIAYWIAFALWMQVELLYCAQLSRHLANESLTQQLQMPQHSPLR